MCLILPRNEDNKYQFVSITQQLLMDPRLWRATKARGARVKCTIEYYVAAMQRFAYVASHVPTYLHPPTRHS